MTKTVDAIVRGPMPYFGKDGVLYMPDQVVHGVPAEDVSEDTITKTAEVEAKNGELRERKIEVKAPFKPLDAKASVVAEPVDTAAVATGNPDRLNVTDFLKGGKDDIIAAITNGTVDDHLAAIEQAEIARKGPARSEVKQAIAARIAATTRP